MSLAKDVALRIPPARRLIEQRDALARENADLRREIELARRRADLRYVFIVTYGRSGSTLLQGILNSVPGYLIRGENDGALELLQEPMIRLDKRAESFGGTKPTSSWYGLNGYSHAEAAEGIRRYLLDVLIKPGTDTRVTGFKEIRWWKRDLLRTLELTREIFPGARFVVNTRDAESVIKSKWWAKKDPEAALAQVADYEARMDKACAALGDATYRLHYDEWIADPGVLEGLFDWLGEPFDRAKVDDVLATPHSSAGPTGFGSSARSEV